MADDRKPLIWAPSARPREEVKIWIPGARNGSPEILKPKPPEILMMQRKPLVILNPKLARKLGERVRAWRA